MKNQVQYRIWQFFQSFKQAPSLVEQRDAAALLTPEQLGLFQRMEPSEISHSLRVFETLRDEYGENRNLLVAGLLHDVGKQKVPLRRWERVLIVLLNGIVPRKVKLWGKELPNGWNRAFVVAQQHAQWGAEMAAEAGCAPLIVWLIKNHEHEIPVDPPSPQAIIFLRQLQNADNKN